MKKLLPIIICSLIFLSLSSCGEHTHVFSTTVEEEAGCGKDGTLARRCAECAYVEYDNIPATGNHSFGSWTQSSPTSMYRTCTVCSTVESAPFYSTEDEGVSDTHSYTTFLSFAEDCQISGSTMFYEGPYNKITVSLGSGNSVDSCENRRIVIPARVTDVQFIGLSSGSPFANLRFEFEERVNDINLTFNDVRIESTDTIITSLSRSINFNMKMLGNNCSFICTHRGSDGADGQDGATNDTDRVYGKAGADGKAAFIINGYVTINSQASMLQIQGGSGGDGGDGGHIITSSAPSGGNGGNGGNAIKGEELANVYVASGCNANIHGGRGGNGGNGGSSDAGYWGTNRKGAAGSNGADGISGCNIAYN